MYISRVNVIYVIAPKVYIITPIFNGAHLICEILV